MEAFRVIQRDTILTRREAAEVTQIINDTLLLEPEFAQKNSPLFEANLIYEAQPLSDGMTNAILGVEELYRSGLIPREYKIPGI